MVFGKLWVWAFIICFSFSFLELMCKSHGEAGVKVSAEVDLIDVIHIVGHGQ